MILFFFGPPGAGKGTQAKFISNKLNITHLSTGDILREELLKENQLSSKLKKIMDSGELVSDDILNKIVASRIKQRDCVKGFIFDGYPRTINQNNFVEDFFSQNNLIIDHIFLFNVNDQSIMNRISSRALLENREDDKYDTIKTRISKYYYETKPVLDYYEMNYGNICHTVDGNQSIEKLNIEILKILEKQ